MFQTFPEQNRPSSGYNQMAQEKQGKRNQTCSNYQEAKAKNLLVGPKHKRRRSEKPRKSHLLLTSFFLCSLPLSKKPRFSKRNSQATKTPTLSLSLSREILVIQSRSDKPKNMHVGVCVKKKKQKLKKNPRKIYT